MVQRRCSLIGIVQILAVTPAPNSLLGETYYLGQLFRYGPAAMSEKRTLSSPNTHDKPTAIGLRRSVVVACYKYFLI
jgi:hypothetical protein